MPVNYEGTMEKIRALAEGSRPDSETALVLYERRCLPLLSPSEIPKGKAEECRARSVLNRVCLRERYAACRGVFEALEAGGIPYAVIKGAVFIRSRIRGCVRPPFRRCGHSSSAKGSGRGQGASFGAGLSARLC